jgi:hypothetical protein
LLGYEESGGDGYPVKLPGVKKTLSSNRLKQYDTPELAYYFAVYCNTNRYGLPFKDWTETPVWLLRLMSVFEAVMKECAEYKRRK